jgi:hypothetical protein
MAIGVTELLVVPVVLVGLRTALNVGWRKGMSQRNPRPLDGVAGTAGSMSSLTEPKRETFRRWGDLLGRETIAI